jgi:hypothetical protein
MAATPKIPLITIRAWTYKCFFIADAFDETKQFRGDCISFSRKDIDSFIERWKEHAEEVVIEDVTQEVSHEAV